MGISYLISDSRYLKVEGDTCELNVATSISIPNGYVPCSVKKKTVIDVLVDDPVPTIITILIFVVLVAISISFCVLKNNTEYFYSFILITECKTVSETYLVSKQLQIIQALSL